MDEQELDLRLLEEFYVGHAAECEDLSKDYMDRAGRAFARDDEETARQFRALAKELTEKGKTWRTQQNGIRVKLGRNPV